MNTSKNRPPEDYFLGGEEKNRIVKGMLYLVATPVGNLYDLSPRAAKVFREVDFIAAEDTRNTQKLLAFLGIKKELVSYHEHNKRERGEIIVTRLASGESCALVSDAGTPAISDPGEDLVALCAGRHIPVTAIPGPCAAVLALTLSALPAGRFVFEGFLPTEKSARKERLSALVAETRSIVLYEAPHKLRNTLSELYDTLGNRRLALCRELTKLNEEILRTDLAGAAAHYRDREPRGEYVLVIEGGAGAKSAPAFWKSMTVAEHVAHYMQTEGLSKMDAIKAAAKDRGVAKNVIYRQVNAENSVSTQTDERT